MPAKNIAAPMNIQYRLSNFTPESIVPDLYLMQEAHENQRQDPLRVRRSGSGNPKPAATVMRGAPTPPGHGYPAVREAANSRTENPFILCFW